MVRTFSWICFECDHYNKKDLDICEKCEKPARKHGNDMTDEEIQKEQLDLARKHRNVKTELSEMLEDLKKLNKDDIDKKYDGNLQRAWSKKKWELEKIAMRKDELGL